jgi:hypothetical protein
VLDDLPELGAGVRGVLEMEATDGDDRDVLIVWDGFVRWSGAHLRPQQRC